MPAPEDYGIRFKRVDLENSPEIPADIDHVVDISRGTTIAVGEAQVKTVEHVLAAIMGVEIDNLIVELDTNEPPVIDGSAKPFIDLLISAGFTEQSEPKDYLVIDSTIHYRAEDGTVDIVAFPLDDFKVTVMIDYRNPALGSQYTSLFSMSEFPTEFAPARTFCFLHEVETLYEQGLIQGGKFDNAVVIVDRELSEKQLSELMHKLGISGSVVLGQNGILNNTQLRFTNEPVRRKFIFETEQFHGVVGAKIGSGNLEPQFRWWSIFRRPSSGVARPRALAARSPPHYLGAEMSLTLPLTDDEQKTPATLNTSK